MRRQFALSTSLHSFGRRESRGRPASSPQSSPAAARHARRHVAFGYERAARRGRSRTAALKTANIADELPDLLVAQSFIWRHLRARHALPNRTEEVGIAVALF